MIEKIIAFRTAVLAAAENPNFAHYQWFVVWHLNLVERIAKELANFYPNAAEEMIEVLVWLHDYGQLIDGANEQQATATAGRAKLTEIGFEKDFIDKAISYADMLYQATEIDLHEAPIEVRIISSADGCAHLVGPYLQLWWRENASKSLEEVMADNRKKTLKDWNYKVVLPEARRAFAARYQVLMEQNGQLPAKFFS